MGIKKSLDTIVFLEVTQDLSHLSENERGALRHCVSAAQIITELYLAQRYPENLRLREELRQRTDQEGKDLLRYFELNGGPWDQFNEQKSFIPGVAARTKGLSFYPAGITEEEWKSWLAEHPDERTSFESNYTVIKKVNGVLMAVPYSDAYSPFLEKAAQELTSASALLPESNLKKFLALRAEAFLSNNYWDSDIAWIDTDGSPFEVTIGPYEVYEDELFGIKANFEAFVALPDQEATAEIQKFAAALPEFDAILSARLGYKAKGSASPMEVVRDIYRGGEAAFGRTFVAYNLPNNRKIHEIKGSKKVFSKTMMEAKFSHLTEPVAKRVLRPSALKQFNFRHRMLFVLGHELAHGIGPGTREVDGREISFEVLLKDLHSMLEEAKADMLGVALLDHFYKKGLLTQEELLGCVVSEVASFLPAWRASYTEAHAKGALIEYNWLKHHGAVGYDNNEGKFDIDAGKTLAAMISLSEEFLRIQMDGDYQKASDFVEQWGFVAPEIPPIIDRLKDIPIEVHPVYKV